MFDSEQSYFLQFSDEVNLNIEMLASSSHTESVCQIHASQLADTSALSDQALVDVLRSMLEDSGLGRLQFYDNLHVGGRLLYSLATLDCDYYYCYSSYALLDNHLRRYLVLQLQLTQPTSGSYESTLLSLLRHIHVHDASSSHPTTRT